MTRSESITHLATALALAQAEMPVAVFDATNKFLNNKYASLGAVIEASRPILAKHKLSLVQFPISGVAEEIRHLTPALARSRRRGCKQHWPPQLAGTLAPPRWSGSNPS